MTKAGFNVVWFEDSSEADNDFENCTLANYRRLPNSGAYHVISHGSPGRHLSVYATDSDAGRNACQNWVTGGGAGLTVVRSPGNYYFVEVDTAWLTANFQAAATANRTFAHWAICYSESIMNSAGGRWKIGYTNPTNGIEARNTIERILQDMNGTTNDGTRRTAGKSWHAGGFSANVVMRGYERTTLTVAPMMKNATDIFHYPVDPVSDNKLYYGGIILDTYIDNRTNANEALIFTGVGGTQDVPKLMQVSAGDAFGLGFYFKGTGKTARAVADKCISRNTGRPLDEGRPLDGDRKNGINNPIPDNIEWSL